MIENKIYISLNLWIFNQSVRHIFNWWEYIILIKTSTNNHSWKSVVLESSDKVVEIISTQLLLYLSIVLPRIDNTWFRVKVYFTNTRNMHCMPLGYIMHVPSVSEIYLGQGTSIWNPGENHAKILGNFLVLLRIDDTWSRDKVYFTETGNMHYITYPWNISWFRNKHMKSWGELWTYYL